jgi:hypothetical protein
MITLLYIFLIYILLGGLTYLIAQNHQFNNKELTYPKMIFFYISDILFKPVIHLIEFIDNYKIFLWAKKQYKVMLKDKSLTQEQRQGIIDEKDEIINYLINLCEDNKDEE